MSLNATATAPDRDRPAAAARAGEMTPVSLVARLGAALESSGVRYCQWKGHGKAARWSAGEGDIDLLVERTDGPAFARSLEDLGFKPAIAAPAMQVPGVMSWLGLEPSHGRLIHVHAHFKLILGRADARHYHLPVEHAVLDSAVPAACFRTPAAEMELILFVLQQTLKHTPFATRGAVRERLDLLQAELRRLERETDDTAVARAVTTHLPGVGPAVFARCLASLRPAQPQRARIAARLELARRLGAQARGGTTLSFLRRAARRIARAVGPNTVGAGKTLAGGGSVIALLGADGAGKSTCARALLLWLGSELKTCHAHLGLPPRALTTKIVGALLKMGQRLDGLRGRRKPSQLTAHLELARHVCTGRDRYLLHRRMRRFAAAGGIAICERYPTPENGPLAGPSKAQGLALDAQSRLARGLRRLENYWYRLITAPDQTIVLRVDPETAVRRKTDEPEAYVRARARRMWETDWSKANAELLDAGRDLDVVLADLRATVWKAL